MNAARKKPAAPRKKVVLVDAPGDDADELVSEAVAPRQMPEAVGDEAGPRTLDDALGELDAANRDLDRATSKLDRLRTQAAAARTEYNDAASRILNMCRAAQGQAPRDFRPLADGLRKLGALAPRPEPKRPLMEGRSTFCVPWDAWPVTLEVKVFAAGSNDEEKGADSAEEAAGLRDAAWTIRDFGSLTIAFRVIA